MVGLHKKVSCTVDQHNNMELNTSKYCFLFLLLKCELVHAVVPPALMVTFQGSNVCAYKLEIFCKIKDISADFFQRAI